MGASALFFSHRPCTHHLNAMGRTHCTAFAMCSQCVRWLPPAVDFGFCGLSRQLMFLCALLTATINASKQCLCIATHHRGPHVGLPVRSPCIRAVCRVPGVPACPRADYCPVARLYAHISGLINIIRDDVDGMRLPPQCLHLEWIGWCG